MPSQTKFPSSFDVNGVSGAVDWTSPGNCSTSDDDYASSGPIAPFGSPGNSTHHLVLSDFGFSIPAGATILGIEISVEEHCDHGLIEPFSVYIGTGGIGGANNAGWGGGILLRTSDYSDVFGDATELWSQTWTADDINSSGFRVYLRYDNRFADSGNDTVYVDQVLATVYYTRGTPTATLTNDGYRANFGEGSQSFNDTAGEMNAGGIPPDQPTDESLVRFLVDAAGPIANATLTVYVSTYSFDPTFGPPTDSGTALVVDAVAADDQAWPTNATEAFALTSFGTNFSYSGAIPVGFNGLVSIDVTAVLQEILDRGGWNFGQHVIFRIATGDYWHILGFATEENTFSLPKAALAISYGAEQATGAPLLLLLIDEVQP